MSAVSGHPLKTLKEYALGENHNYPDQSGGDIENVLLKERVALMATALEQTKPAKTCPPPYLSKKFERARSRPVVLPYAKAHDTDLDRHGPNVLHTYGFVEPLPSDKPIPLS